MTIFAGNQPLLFQSPDEDSIIPESFSLSA